MKGGPEKLIPTHITPESEEERKAREKGASAKELHKLHHEELEKAPDFDDILRKELKEKGIEPPPQVNLSLLAVEEFQRFAKEAQDLRKVARYAKDPEEKLAAVKAYDEKKQKIDEYFKYGSSFEKAYREYIDARHEYLEFESSLEKLRRLESGLEEPAFKSVAAGAKLDAKAYARLEGVMRETDSKNSKDHEKEAESILESLKTIYPEESKEYKEAAEALLREKGAKLPRTKKEIVKEMGELRKKVGESWENPMVRYFSNKEQIEKTLKDYAEGKDVIETQSVVKDLNELHEWEKQHQRTTIGGVLVGPPGVGKTTLLRHYLEEKGRKYVYIDLSEDVTRYMLYGTKSIEFKSPAEYYKRLTTDLASLDEDTFKKFVQENSKSLQEVFNIKKEEGVATFLGQLDEELGKGGDLPKDLADQIDGVRKKVNQLSNQAFRKELAQEFYHTVKRNGWRDGVVVSALRSGDSVIFDEFNKNKNWSLIYGLMTAKPGESWYFADNQEEIKIPDTWRMYFTANIGKKHGGFEVAEALASRAQGKVMEMPYPPRKEEMQIALAALSNPEGDFLRSKDDLAKLYVLINEIFPKVRSFIEDKRQVIPISFRTLRDLGEKLVLYRDPKTGKPVYHPSDKSFDEAVYDVLVESYSLYEDKTTPKEIVSLATSAGLLLDDRVKEKVTQWIGKEEFEKRQKTFAEHKEDFNEIVKKIRGMSREMTEVAVPEQRKF